MNIINIMGTRNNKNYLDITETGEQSYRDLQEQNELGKTLAPENDLSGVDLVNSYFGYDSVYSPSHASGVVTPINVDFDWGTSMFDAKYATGDQVNQLQDIRAENQPSVLKLAAGIGKGAVLTGTTFVDGTLGFVYGIGTAIAEKRFSGLWDNDVSNAMHEINELSEKLMPNYRTIKEDVQPWYKNMGTMNFWADTIIKNLGFTVGAFYSGKIWTLPLKFLKAPALAAEIVGSTLSAINEGRIEATNNTSDYIDSHAAKINSALNSALQDLDPTDPEYQTKKEILIQRADDQLTELQKRADNMGLFILLANTVLLSYNNFKTFGKIYSGGFTRAQKAFLDSEKHELGKRVSREAGKYLFKEYTTKEGIKEGLKIGMREGFEETNQKWISTAAGYSQDYDSPDAYYNALINPDSDLKTTNFLSAIGKGFVDTYGNVDSYQEWFAGAFTGILGIPTFGRMSNASSSTYLGRNRVIGLTGGLFGQLSQNKERNNIAQGAVDVMNKYITKIQDQKGYFAQSQSFIDAMDRWSAENNKFEYKNAEDNDDFAAIAAFARLGKLDDLKGMIDIDFENMSDEDLAKIARYTSQESDGSYTPTSGWRNVDGTYLSDTEEGRETMRKELAKKRDKTKNNIEEYAKSVEIVRGILHESPQVTDDQVSELAWLHWKQGRFQERFTQLKEENKDLINTYIADFTEMRDSLEKELSDVNEALAKDPNDNSLKESKEETESQLAAYDSFITFFNRILKDKSPLALGEIMSDSENNSAIKKLIEEYFDVEKIEVIGGLLKGSDAFESLFKGKVEHSEAQKFYTDLNDIAKIAVAARQFNERYKEFTSDPMSIIRNRKKLIDKIEEKAKKSRAENLANKFDENPEEALNEVSAEELKKIFEEAEDEEHDYSKQVEELERILELQNTKEEILRHLQGESAQLISDVKYIFSRITRLEDLYNYDSEAYNSLSGWPLDDSLKNLQDYQIQILLEERIAKAKTCIEQARKEIEEEQSNIDNIKENIDDFDNTDPTDVKETGNDSTPTTETFGSNTSSTKNGGEAAFSLDKDTIEIAEDLNIDVKKEENRKILSELQAVLRHVKSLYDAGKTLGSVDTIETTALKSAGYNPQAIAAQYFIDLMKREENPINPTESTPSADVEGAIKKENDSILVGSSNSPQKFYLSPIQSRLPIHINPDSEDPRIPYYKLVKDSSRYSEAQKKYIQAVGEYLDDKGAWDRADAGLVKVGDEIHFTTDEELNKKANAFVVLITDKDGNVLGNLPTATDNDGNTLDSTFNSYEGLTDLITALKKEYDEKKTMSPVTHVNKWMIGKVMYSKEDNAVSEISTTIDSNGQTTSVPPIFAIAASTKSGEVRIVKDSAQRSKDAADPEILKPLNIRNGQPYILIKTQNNGTIGRKYVAVPVHMDVISASHTTELANYVKESINNVFKLNNQSSPTTIGKLKLALENVVGAKFHITTAKGYVEVSFTDKTGSKHYARSTDDLIAELEKAGVRYQVSLQNINTSNFNRMYAPHCHTNLMKGTTSTVSNWFTLNRLANINGKLEEVKAKSPTSTGQNPSATPSTSTTSTFFEFDYPAPSGTFHFKIDTESWNFITFTKEDGSLGSVKVRTDTGEAKAKEAAVAAYAYGLFKHYDMSIPYNTQWGNYDPAKKEFIKTSPEQQSPQSNHQTKPENKPQATEFITKNQLVEACKKYGLLKDRLDTVVLNHIDDEFVKGIQKVYPVTLDSLDEAFCGSVLDILKNHYDAKTNSFQGERNRSFDGKMLAEEMVHFRKVTTLDSTEEWSETQEVNWLKRVLPQFNSGDRLQIVNALIKISNSKNPGRAWGQFKNGVIIIYKHAASGTLYHEAFHAVTHTILDTKELSTLYESAKTKYGNLSTLELEEKLAEDFRMYTQYEQDPNVSVLTRLFRKIKHFVQTLYGNDRYINNLFYRINRGRFKKASISKSTSTLNRETTDSSVKWAQTADNNYEVSTQRDGRFSALNAKFKEGTTLFGHDVSGRTIESVYQHGVKQGDWTTNDNTKTGAPSSKDIITGDNEDASYTQGYLPLWQEWAKQNPTLIKELSEKVKGKTLTDQFASSKVSQARALADILNSLSQTNNEKQEDEYEKFKIQFYHANKTSYSALSQEDLKILNDHNINQKYYESLSADEQAHLLWCK